MGGWVESTKILGWIRHMGLVVTWYGPLAGCVVKSLVDVVDAPVCANGVRDVAPLAATDSWQSFLPYVA